MATSRSVATEIANFLDYLVDADIAIYAQPVVVSGGTVSWRTTGASSSFLATRKVTSLDDYRHWLESGAYSALLYEGSLLQLTYEFEGSQVMRHRLAYVPAPFDFDEELLREESPADVLDAYLAGGFDGLRLESVLRFDFDREAGAPGHPSSHLTVNSSDCRIACKSPLHVGHFAEFVFGNFFPRLWRAHPFLSGLSSKDLERQTLTHEEARGIHVAWAR